MKRTFLKVHTNVNATCYLYPRCNVVLILWDLYMVTDRIKRINFHKTAH